MVAKIRNFLEKTFQAIGILKPNYETSETSSWPPDVDILFKYDLSGGDVETRAVVLKASDELASQMEFDIGVHEEQYVPQGDAGPPASILEQLLPSKEYLSLVFGSIVLIISESVVHGFFGKIGEDAYDHFVTALHTVRNTFRKQDGPTGGGNFSFLIRGSGKKGIWLTVPKDLSNRDFQNALVHLKDTLRQVDLSKLKESETIIYTYNPKKRSWIMVERKI